MRNRRLPPLPIHSSNLKHKQWPNVNEATAGELALASTHTLYVREFRRAGRSHLCLHDSQRPEAPNGSWKHDKDQDRDERPAARNSNASSTSDTVVVSNLHYEVMPADLMVSWATTFVMFNWSPHLIRDHVRLYLRLWAPWLASRLSKYDKPPHTALMNARAALGPVESVTR